MDVFVDGDHRNTAFPLSLGNRYEVVLFERELINVTVVLTNSRADHVVLSKLVNIESPVTDMRIQVSLSLHHKS